MTSQFQVLNKILQTKDFSLVTLNNLTSDHFFNYKTEFNYICDHYERYGTVPDRITFIDTFTEFDIIDVAEPDSYLIEQLYTDYNSAFLASKFNDIKSYIEKNDVAGAMACLTKAANEMHSGTSMTCTDLFSDTSRYEKYLERMQNKDQFYIRTGFPELDAIIGGIDMKEEDMVIAARTGQGKTWTLLKIAVEAAKQGLTVGMYSGEMSADKVGYRVDTLLGHIDNKAITRGTTYDGSVPVRYKQYLDNIKNICPGTIKILTPNDINGPATVNALRTFIEREHLDILLVDQYSLLEDQHHAKTTHEKVANISKDIKNLQVMHRIPIVSVSQMNRTKNENGEQDTTQIGLSDRIGQDATTILMLDREVTYKDQDKRQVADDKLVINIVKSRDGGNGKLVYRADFNLGNFIFLDPEQSDEAAEDLRSYYEEEQSDSDVPW
jgi:replicative DNA helicase